MQSDTATKPQQIYQVFITSRYFLQRRRSVDSRAGLGYVRVDDNSLLVDGVVVEAVPPRRLVHTWHMVYDTRVAADAPRRVTWEIEPVDGGGSKLTVTHDGFDGETGTGHLLGHRAIHMHLDRRLAFCRAHRGRSENRLRASRSRDVSLPRG